MFNNSGQQSSQETYSSSGPNMGALNQGYAAALKRSNSDYAKILKGYAQVQKQYRDDAAAAERVYGAAFAGVAGDLDKTGAAEKQAIIDQYTAAQGAAKQNLISKGLGNSTVQSAVSRGLEYDRAKADVALTGNLAGIRANYRSQIGIAQGNAATQLASGMANIGAQGWGLQAQGAGQRANLDQTYMGQLHSSQSHSVGTSSGTSRGGALGGGSGGGSAAGGFFGPMSNPMGPAAYPNIGMGGGARPSAGPYGGGGSDYQQPQQVAQGGVQYYPLGVPQAFGGDYGMGGDSVDFGGDNPWSGESDYSQLDDGDY